MTRHVYQQVSAWGRKSLPCPTCGKKVRRRMTFTNTINPFNRNAAGEIKDWHEVRADVLALAAEWESQPVVCTFCSEVPS